MTGTLKRSPLLAAGLLFAVFIANTVYGKIAILRGATETPGLGDVGEFLVLFIAVLFFIVACVSREKAEAKSSQSDNQGANLKSESGK